jgi:UDP-N-acetylmuramyl pentapeptide phosphotransferase/UDP-N-acetylglucosamine-1-phosphate transferase
MIVVTRGWWLIGLAFVLSLVLTRLAIAYAHRRGMLDEPGRRRSHVIATPRGGGIGLVAASVIAAIIALAYWPGGRNGWLVVACAIAGVLVAVVGWVDDHRETGVVPRLAAQVVAAAMFSVVLVGTNQLAWAWLLLLVPVAVSSINLHNFMDGTDAILGLQVVFVGAGLGVLAWMQAQPAVAIVAFAMAAAAIGFLRFNWPPARIFMGDVGSGFAGFWIFALIALIAVRAPMAVWPALILVSAFVMDAGLTLAWRMWCGKRWYTAHREHLYQWLVRSGFSHAQVAGWYLAWNLAVAAPVAAWATWQPSLGPWSWVALDLIAAVVWWQGRRALIGRARHGGEGRFA